MLRDPGQEGDVLLVEAHQVARGVGTGHLHEPVGDEVLRVDPNRVQGPVLGGAVKRDGVDRCVLTGRDVELFDMEANARLADDLNERWICRAVELSDVHLGALEDFLDPCRAVVGGFIIGDDHYGHRFDPGRRDGLLFHHHTGFDGFWSPQKIAAVVQRDDRINP